jgi:hypothetical protein
MIRVSAYNEMFGQRFELPPATYSTSKEASVFLRVFMEFPGTTNAHIVSITAKDGAITVVMESESPTTKGHCVATCTGKTDTMKEFTKGCLERFIMSSGSGIKNNKTRG